MERVYKAGPRVANNLVKLSDSVSNQIFARYSPVPENPSEDCLFNYQRRDNSGSNGAGMGEGPDDLLTPLARHKRDRNEWRTRYRPPDRASVAYEANLWPVGLDAADYKANIFFRCFVLRVFSKCREAKTTEIQRWIEITRIDDFSRSLPFTIFDFFRYMFDDWSTEAFPNQLSNIVLLAYDEREIYIVG